MAENKAYAINIDSPIAVYVQIENQVQFAIAAGTLKPGDSLPSVREMSQMLNINPNTVTKSYRDLELMQLVQTRRGVGVTVTAAAPKLCRTSIKNMVKVHLIDAVAECRCSGMDADEINKIVKSTISGEVKPYQTAF
jgi:GntR family transcriptional regulator